MKRLSIGLVTLCAVACVTTSPSAIKSEGGNFSVSCRDDFSLQFSQAKGIECDFYKISPLELSLSVASVTVPQGFEILTPSDVEELHQKAKLDASRHGIDLTTVIIGTSLASKPQGVEALASVVAVTGGLLIMNQLGLDAAKEPDFSSWHLMSHEPINLSGDKPAKRFLYAGSATDRVPETITLCFSMPKAECLVLPVEPDLIRMRQRRPRF